MQAKFIEDIFRSVQLEYEAEGIQVDESKDDDNTDVLDPIEGTLPFGMNREGICSEIEKEAHYRELTTNYKVFLFHGPTELFKAHIPIHIDKVCPKRYCFFVPFKDGVKKIKDFRKLQTATAIQTHVVKYTTQVLF